MGNIFKVIAKTIQGKTGVGKFAHKLLPFKKVRSAVGSVILGIKKAAPLPEFKDPAVRETVTIANRRLARLTGDGDNLAKATQLKDAGDQQILQTINEVRDILDDGKMNDSYRDLSPRVKKIITQSFSAVPLVAYIVYAITTGDFSLTGFFNYVQMFFGI